MKIYKYALLVEDYQELDLPLGARVLSVGVQAGEIVIWVLVDETAAPAKAGFWIRSTGHDATGMSFVRFLGTVQHGPLVWHVFTDDAS